MFRLPFAEVQAALEGVLVKLGMAAERATLCARLFCETTEDGVYTHGLNRFPRLVKTIRNGCVDVTARPGREAGFGGLERWNGNRGVGNVNAWESMERAIALSREHGIGCVALAHTNHWMRGGTYAWQAANGGAVGLCWTNTMVNLPPWGGLKAAVGNNPMAIGVPRKAGHVVLDIAMSQFSYGAIEAYRKRNEPLPVAGGFDEEGNLTQDAAAIERTLRLLPMGYWKGSGLSVLLDMTAAMLSLGTATWQIPQDSLREADLSQIFIAIHPAALGPVERCEAIANEIVDAVHACPPVKEGQRVRYPGEQTLKVRAENQKLGIPVEEATWAEILAVQGMVP